MGREVGVSHPLQTIICVFGELCKLDIILLALIVFQVLFQALGFPGDSVVKNLPANAGDTGDVGLIPGLGSFPREVNGNPLHILSWKVHGQRRLVGYCPRVAKS